MTNSFHLQNLPSRKLRNIPDDGIHEICFIIYQEVKPDFSTSLCICGLESKELFLRLNLYPIIRTSFIFNLLYNFVGSFGLFYFSFESSSIWVVKIKTKLVLTNLPISETCFSSEMNAFWQKKTWNIMLFWQKNQFENISF